MKLRLFLLATAALVAVAMLMPTSGTAANCGRYLGAKIVTHGVSCSKAKSIYRKFKRGDKLPKGWVCGLSAGGCSKGSKSFTFRLN